MGEALNTALPTDFAYALRKVTEIAACAAADWIGRGEKERGDGAAVTAMRTVLNRLPIDGRIVIGEGEKDEAPMLYNGETVGTGGPALDIAVDPVEGTSYLAKGLTNAMATIAVAPRGAMFDPGPAFYMRKFAAPGMAKGKVDPTLPTREILAGLAKALGKPISDLHIYVLEKPRHKRLVREIHEAGARTMLYPAGDVAGAIMAALPGAGIDALLGTGGTPEGLLTACAIQALGGEFMGKLDPQLHTEKKAVDEAGLDINHWMKLDQLVHSNDVVFCATGITTGLLFDGVEEKAGHYRTQTLMLSGARRERQILTSWLHREEVEEALGAATPEATADKKGRG
ncbi:MAG: fructose-bisphosphatase class II [Robiginitomaculum sp.]|nr:MAG: fructose-bisphosphatase class II [Robiginitomaculum sp.]